MADEAIVPLYFRLPFPPTVNNLFINGRGGKGRFTSPAYREWKKAAGTLAKEQANGKRIAGTYAMEVRLVRPDARRRDASNYLKAVEDLFVALQVIDDDSECQFVSAEWVKKGPACFVAIRPCLRWGGSPWISAAEENGLTS